MPEFEISEGLYAKLKVVYEQTEDRSNLMHPDSLRYSPAFWIIENLRNACDSMTANDQESNELFAKYYSVCIRGGNPLKDRQLKSAKIDPKKWKKALNHFNGEILS